jgi:NADH-quinone oxidoreductase subunit M
MADAGLLNLLLFLPLVGVALLALLPARADGAARQFTLVVTLVQFVLAAWLYVRFDPTDPALQFATRLPWIASWGVHYHTGLDGFNVLLVLLTTFLGPLVVAGAFSAIQKDVKLFYAMVFFIQFTMLGTFSRRICSVLHVLGAMLIPMFLIIGIWGRAAHLRDREVRALHRVRLDPDARRDHLPRLVAAAGHRRDLVLVRRPVPAPTADRGAGLAARSLALSFAIMPIVPFHTLLPDAHVEAPTAGSVILAGRC